MGIKIYQEEEIDFPLVLHPRMKLYEIPSIRAGMSIGIVIMWVLIRQPYC